MIVIRLLCALLCVPGFFLLYSAGALLYRLSASGSGERGDVELHVGCFVYLVDPAWIGGGMLAAGLSLLWFAFLGIHYDGERKS